MRKKIIQEQKLFLILLFSVVSIFSCATAIPQWVPEILSLDEATINKLNTYLEEGRYGTVLQDVMTLKREYPGRITNEIFKIEEEALVLLRNNFTEAVNAEEWGEALAYYSEISVIPGIGIPEFWTRGSLLRKLSESQLGDSTISALINFQKSLSWDLPDYDTFIKYGNLALEEECREVLRVITLQMDIAGMESPPSFKEFLNQEGTPIDFMVGTVTIWVNKGIRLEQGMGYADRVIGSGFFIDKRGYLVTNYHVIESEVDPEYSGFSRLYIRLPGEQGDKIPAEVVGWDPVFDIALLKTSMEPGYIFSFKDDAEYVPGDKIYAIGSPGGLENTITSGIISATGRKLLEMGDTIQVDVPINSGNSGGPLLNESGELIGVVFAGIEQFEGVNFAIPSNWLSSRIPSFYQGERQNIPWMGLSVYEGKSGLEALYTYPASPVERCGIHPGDKLLSVNGVSVTTAQEVQKIMLSLDGQRIIAADWRRGEEEFSTIINLEERPVVPLEQALEIDSIERLVLPLFGMDIESTGSKNYVIKKVYPGMTAEETGLSENDPLTIYDWNYEEEYQVLLIEIRVKKRKAGFMESVVQIAAYVKVSNLI